MIPSHDQRNPCSEVEDVAQGSHDDLDLLDDTELMPEHPAEIDREALVGVGDLTTPRWTQFTRFTTEKNTQNELADMSFNQQLVSQDADGHSDEDLPGSPWTIEAIDGDVDALEVGSNRRTVCIHSLFFVQDTVTRVLPRRSQQSLADESQEEEIVYPRKMGAGAIADQHAPNGDSTKVSSSTSLHDSLSRLPIASAGSLKKLVLNDVVSEAPRLHASNDFTSQIAPDDRKELVKAGIPTRKHHSTGLSISPQTSSSRLKSADRKKDESPSEHSTGLKPPKRSEKHSRHGSLSSSSHDVGERRQRRSRIGADGPIISASASPLHNKLRTKNSVEPVSPAAAFEESVPSVSSTRLVERELRNSPSVAHSLLRGTQEGWSALDDEATVEALRKLDGLSGLSRARASVGSTKRVSTHSRPATPGAPKGNTTDGSEKLVHKASIKSHKRDGSLAREVDRRRPKSAGVSDKESPVIEPGVVVNTSSPLDIQEADKGNQEPVEELPPSPAIQSKVGRKSNIVASSRSSYVPKRGSMSSTNHSSIPATASRDSTSLYTATNVTSAVSSRHTGKAKRNSGGSDASSIHSTDISTRDRVASLSSTGDLTEDHSVPPVPPLPKGISRLQPTSSNSMTFPEMPEFDPKAGSIQSPIPLVTSDDQHLSADSQIGLRHSSPIKTLEKSPVPVQVGLQTPAKTPSRKWSFSKALNLKQGGSSSSPSAVDSPGVSMSPRSAGFGRQLHGQASKEPLFPSITFKSGVEDWSDVKDNAMSSATSLVSISSVGTPMSTSSASPTHTSTRLQRPIGGADLSLSNKSKPRTSISARYTSSSPSLNAPQPLTSKRLTPSFIPSFRRSSSQSIQLAAETSRVALSSSPSLSLTPNTSAPIGRGETPIDASLSSPTTPGRKTSMLSLGSLLKGSSSRRSLLPDKKDSIARDPGTPKQKDSEKNNDINKKSDKERSESRISVLMGRKRGKVVLLTYDLSYMRDDDITIFRPCPRLLKIRRIYP